MCVYCVYEIPSANISWKYCLVHILSLPWLLLHWSSLELSSLVLPLLIFLFSFSVPFRASVRFFQLSEVRAIRASFYVLMDWQCTEEMIGVGHRGWNRTGEKEITRPKFYFQFSALLFLFVKWNMTFLGLFLLHIYFWETTSDLSSHAKIISSDSRSFQTSSFTPRKFVILNQTHQLFKFEWTFWVMYPHVWQPYVRFYLLINSLGTHFCWYFHSIDNSMWSYGGNKCFTRNDTKKRKVSTGKRNFRQLQSMKPFTLDTFVTLIEILPVVTLRWTMKGFPCEGGNPNRNTLVNATLCCFL